MPGDTHSGILVATRSAALLQVVESSLLESGLAIRSATSPEEAIAAMLGPIAPGAVLLDSELPGAALRQVLAAVNAPIERRRFPIVLACDSELPAWRGRLSEGIIDDLVPRTLPPFHWRVRFELVLRTFRRTREWEQLTAGAAAMDDGTDPVTGLYRRDAFLTILFRETDRVQRMNTSLSIMMFEIDDFDAWRQRLGAAACDDLLKQAVRRVQRLLRSYDVFGRMGRAAFALCLPGCTTVNALCLAERLRREVFTLSFLAGSSAVRLAVRCAIAPSHGRSPLVVLREAQEALRAAKAQAPGSISTSCDPHPVYSAADYR